MKKLAFIVLILVLFSCGKDKVILLPEINHAEITEITDVSAAYLFYDQTKPDSVELNRKNLISTTNWLVNVDKRLTLKQAIPKIKLLQDKKRNAKMHKNKAAKNYYTCNDTSRKNLGFIEFTDVIYHFEKEIDLTVTHKVTKQSDIDSSKNAIINVKHVKSLDVLMNLDIKINSKNYVWINSTKVSSTLFMEYLTTIVVDKNVDEFIVTLYFNKSISFQDYITFKSILINSKFKRVVFNNNEFIY